jgi:hypothetical protein
MVAVSSSGPASTPAVAIRPRFVDSTSSPAPLMWSALNVETNPGASETPCSPDSTSCTLDPCRITVTSVRTLPGFINGTSSESVSSVPGTTHRSSRDGRPTSARRDPGVTAKLPATTRPTWGITWVVTVVCPGVSRA